MKDPDVLVHVGTGFILGMIASSWWRSLWKKK